MTYKELTTALCFRNRLATEIGQTAVGAIQVIRDLFARIGATLVIMGVLVGNDAIRASNDVDVEDSVILVINHAQTEIGITTKNSPCSLDNKKYAI